MYNVTATATLRILDDAADTSRRLGIDGWLLQLLTVSGIVRFHTGDWAACEDDLAELESLKPDASQAAGLHGMRAVMLAYRGDAAAAASEIAEANRWGETYESAGQLAVLDELNAEVSIAFQRYPEALQSARAGATRAGTSRTPSRWRSWPLPPPAIRPRSGPWTDSSLIRGPARAPRSSTSRPPSAPLSTGDGTRPACVPRRG